MSNKLLIVEESLRDIEAHWFEYLNTIVKSIRKAGWQVDVACNKNADPEVLRTFSAFPVFRRSRYLDKKKKLPGEHFYGFLFHNMYSLRVIWKLLNRNKNYECIFVPTVMIHHLIAWYIVMTLHPNKPRHLVLFFVTPPALWNDKEKKPYFPKSSKVLKKVLALFRPLVKSQRVSFTVNAKHAQEQFEQLSGLPFKLMPHPVSFDNALKLEESQGSSIVSSSEHPANLRGISFACLGFARHEKGSDVLKNAIEIILKKYPDFNGHFTLQWDKGFEMPDGSTCEPGAILKNHPKVKLINKPIPSMQYQALLSGVDCVVLPYRNSSYYARASQAVTEAAFNGIPVIYTNGGWLEENVIAYASGIGITDESVDELVTAILTMQADYKIYKDIAISQLPTARKYLDPDFFCKRLLEPGLGSTVMNTIS